MNRGMVWVARAWLSFIGTAFLGAVFVGIGRLLMDCYEDAEFRVIVLAWSLTVVIAVVTVASALVIGLDRELTSDEN